MGEPDGAVLLLGAGGWWLVLFVLAGLLVVDLLFGVGVLLPAAGADLSTAFRDQPELRVQYVGVLLVFNWGGVFRYFWRFPVRVAHVWGCGARGGTAILKLNRRTLVRVSHRWCGGGERGDDKSATVSKAASLVVELAWWIRLVAGIATQAFFLLAVVIRIYELPGTAFGDWHALFALLGGVFYYIWQAADVFVNAWDSWVLALVFPLRAYPGAWTVRLLAQLAQFAALVAALVTGVFGFAFFAPPSCDAGCVVRNQAAFSMLAVSSFAWFGLSF
jgi:hypothetical protein